MPLKTWDVLGLCLEITACVPGEVKSWFGQVPISTTVVFLTPHLGTARN